VLGDIKHTLKALSLDVETPKQPPIISKLQEQYNEIYYRKNSINDTQLNHIQIIKCINEHLDESILIADIGYYRHHAVLFSRTEGTKQFFTDAGLACFGSGLPSAAAAQLIYPNKKVFLLCGDGDFHSGSGDVETLARHQLPIIINLINNLPFGLIELYQKKATQRKPDRKKILSFTNVDFVKLAEANKCVGVRVHKVDEIADPVRNHNRKQPLLIEVLLNYCSDAKLAPPY
jgi:thiamine pyrophosphate-dependent acetolactate synthase large subunit-like protein